MRVWMEPEARRERRTEVNSRANRDQAKTRTQRQPPRKKCASWFLPVKALEAVGASAPPKRGTEKWTGLQVERKEEGVRRAEVEFRREELKADVRLREDGSTASAPSSWECEDMAAEVRAVRHEDNTATPPLHSGRQLLEYS